MFGLRAELVKDEYGVREETWTDEQGFEAEDRYQQFIHEGEGK
ncbi:hypothetical protein LCGC14_2928640 [marine sediment metagenome]|uniref:Uncharacterized protein n=1 Tax=marine sediment metagenome TaxID=412755 RepID=A0A0F8XLN5_9ZZZZ